MRLINSSMMPSTPSIQGCCGGLHFSDVLTLNVETMAWSSLATTGQRPGTRDSHGAALVGHRMLVFGGTNGGKKVNDLHVLDLRTREWTRPQCKGAPPSPRESHTVTVVGGDRLVVFGGSGEGEGNYLNDVHVLDVPTMTWSTPEVKAADRALPAPRDSHSAVAVGARLFVFGGDCGDRYHGEVDVLDVDTMAWSRVSAMSLSCRVASGLPWLKFDSSTRCTCFRCRLLIAIIFRFQNVMVTC